MLMEKHVIQDRHNTAGLMIIPTEYLYCPDLRNYIEIYIYIYIYVCMYVYFFLILTYNTQSMLDGDFQLSHLTMKPSNYFLTPVFEDSCSTEPNASICAASVLRQICQFKMLFLLAICKKAFLR